MSNPLYSWLEFEKSPHSKGMCGYRSRASRIDASAISVPTTCPNSANWLVNQPVAHPRSRIRGCSSPNWRIQSSTVSRRFIVGGSMLGSYPAPRYLAFHSFQNRCWSASAGSALAVDSTFEFKVSLVPGADLLLPAQSVATHSKPRSASPPDKDWRHRECLDPMS